MKKEYYYIYCQGFLGVKTDLADFKWVYGSAAPEASAEDYEGCLVRFHIHSMPEKQLPEIGSCDRGFQAFAWDEGTGKLYYRRTLLSRFEIGYNLSIKGNEVQAEIGTRYLRLVRNRVMNLHGIYYLLSDVANMLLMRNGYLTLYASAVLYAPQNRGLVFFAPPNTGKTVTAVGLCEHLDYHLVGEDVIITDGKKIYACPWTNSYRKQGRSADSAGSFGRQARPQEIQTSAQSDVTDLFVLSLGKKKTGEAKTDVLRKIRILNGYLFHYFSSPIVRVLGYFDSTYAAPWNRYAEELLEQMAEHCSCRELQEAHTLDFRQKVQRIVSGEEA